MLSNSALTKMLGAVRWTSKAFAPKQVEVGGGLKVESRLYAVACLQN